MNSTRRALLKTAGLAPSILFAGRAHAMTAPALRAPATGSGMKPVREFGRLYDYLKDHALRAREAGSLHLTIRDADFSGETFIGGQWHNFRFVGCRFPESAQIKQKDRYQIPRYQIDQKETSGCTFESCTFGGDRFVELYFGTMRQSIFQGCRFERTALGIGRGTIGFYDCAFGTPQHPYTILMGDGTLPLSACLNSDWRDHLPERIIVLRDCRGSHLIGHYVMANHFVVEGGEFGTLDLGNCRVGKLTVNNTKCDTLDLERALAMSFEIKTYGRILTAGSNFVG